MMTDTSCEWDKVSVLETDTSRVSPGSCDQVKEVILFSPSPGNAEGYATKSTRVSHCTASIPSLMISRQSFGLLKSQR